MIPELEQLGFTRNEANVYAAALKLGSASVQQLANSTGLNRITVHSIVEKFESKQIFTQSYEGKRRRISAAPPARLEFLLNEEEEQIKKKKFSLASVLPSLEDLYRIFQRLVADLDSILISFEFSDLSEYLPLTERVLIASEYFETLIQDAGTGRIVATVSHEAT